MSSFDLSVCSMFLLTPKELKGGHIRTNQWICTNIAQLTVLLLSFHMTVSIAEMMLTGWYFTLLLFYIKLGCKINKMLQILFFRSKKLI